MEKFPESTTFSEKTLRGAELADDVSSSVAYPSKPIISEKALRASLLTEEQFLIQE